MRATEEEWNEALT